MKSKLDNNSNDLNLSNLNERPSRKIVLHNESNSSNKTGLNLIQIKYAFNSYSEFFAGYMAACTNITLLFPMNKLIFRQMLYNISFKEAFVQIKSEGLSNFYRGLLPPLLQKSTSYSIMFGTQHEYYLRLKGLFY